MISYEICREFVNVQAMHFILSQDLLFIMFALMPILTYLARQERNAIFMIHIAMIFIHSVVGSYILIFEKDIIELKYYIGVTILTAVGFLFVILLSLSIWYGGFGDNFALLFDEEDLVAMQIANIPRNVMDSNFYDAFENIHTVIYEPYLTLKNKTCPICLIEYQK